KRYRGTLPPSRHPRQLDDRRGRGPRLRSGSYFDDRSNRPDGLNPNGPGNRSGPPQQPNAGDQAMPLPETIIWKGNEHEVPDLAETEEFVFDSVGETPNGEAVEADHPDSWLSLLGRI